MKVITYPMSNAVLKTDARTNLSYPSLLDSSATGIDWPNSSFGRVAFHPSDGGIYTTSDVYGGKILFIDENNSGLMADLPADLSAYDLEPVTNLVPNPGFEDGTFDNWSVFNPEGSNMDASMINNPSISYEGNFSVLLTNTSGPGQFYRPNIATANGSDTYYCSVMLKAASSTSVTLIIRDSASPYTELASITYVVGTTWENFAIAVKPDNGVSIRFELQPQGTAVSVHVDKVVCLVAGITRIRAINIAGEWVPTASRNYLVLKFDDLLTTYSQTSEGEKYDISKHVSSVTCGSSIDVGFTDATVELENMTVTQLKTFSKTVGHKIKIFLDDGTRIWEGLVVETSTSGYNATINAIGFGITNQWFMANSVYGVSTTMLDVIQDQLLANPYMDKRSFMMTTTGTEAYYRPTNLLDLRYGTLDRPGRIVQPYWNAHWISPVTTRTALVNSYVQSSSALEAEAEIGPLDFETVPTTITDAIETVTAYGTFPLKLAYWYIIDGLYDFAEEYLNADYFVQVWFDQIPVGRIIYRDVNQSVSDIAPRTVVVNVSGVDYDVVLPEMNGDWIITRENIDVYSNPATIEESIEGHANIRRAVFSTGDGETVSTQSAARFPDIIRTGITENAISSGRMGFGEALSVLRGMTDEPAILSRPGELVLSGLSGKNSTTTKRSVASIRAGDTVRISGMSPDTHVYPNYYSSGSRFYVGSTRYSSVDDTMTITAYNKADLVERKLALMDVAGSV